MIVNYYATPKTRAPFCGLRCCGNSFGRCERSMYRHKSGIVNHKLRMRRYAKHADRNLVCKEIEQQIIEDKVEINSIEPYDSIDPDYYDTMILFNHTEQLRGLIIFSGVYFE